MSYIPFLDREIFYHPWGPIAQLEEIYLKSTFMIYIESGGNPETNGIVQHSSTELFLKIGVDNLIIQFWTGAQMIE